VVAVEEHHAQEQVVEELEVIELLVLVQVHYKDLQYF
jgi:hypothetical protein|tara:strand:- start:31 stop:141 length:111 start_codon:yes stop_codon:yes gene_type:complete